MNPFSTFDFPNSTIMEVSDALAAFEKLRVTNNDKDGALMPIPLPRVEMTAEERFFEYVTYAENTSTTVEKHFGGSRMVFDGVRDRIYDRFYRGCGKFIDTPGEHFGIETVKHLSLFTSVLVRLELIDGAFVLSLHFSLPENEDLVLQEMQQELAV